MSLLNSYLIMNMYSEFRHEGKNTMRDKQASPKEYGTYLRKRGRHVKTKKRGKKK